MKIVLAGKQHPRPIHQRIRELPTEALCKQTPADASTARSLGHTGQDLQVRGPDPAGTVREDTSRPSARTARVVHLKCVNCGQGHAATSRLCPKMLEAVSKAKSSHKVSATKQVNRIPAPIPLKNAWTALAVQEVGKEPSTQQVTTILGPNGGKYKVTTVCKEVQTTSDQETRTGKGSCRPSTSYPGLDKTTSAVDDGVSGSDVSKTGPSQDHWPSKTHQPASHKRGAKRTRNKSKMYWRPYR